jgi:hypothetical protein
MPKKTKRGRRARATGETSGPLVARWFQRLFGVVFLIAWLSLGSQVLLLVGSRGLLPAAPWLSALGAHGVSFTDAPTWLWLGASDFALRAGIWAGVVLSLLAVAGIRPQLCFALSTALYLGYAVVCRNFLSFQWDNLLLECGVLACFLPSHRPRRVIHVLFRVLVFKLYFESGIAKAESPIGDWLDGSAMRYYYETAPIPTWLGRYFHALPASWHHIESNVTLLWEIGVPFLIFAPRRVRLAALAIFTLFQLINIATANYGFFSYLALVLGVFLLDDADLERLGSFCRARVPRRARELGASLGRRLDRIRELANWSPRFPARARRLLDACVATLVSAIWVSVSYDDGIRMFAQHEIRGLDAVADAVAPFRLINDYHLFMQVTRERIEPTFETGDGTKWTEHSFVYKPGPVSRRPPFVAPHQPRVDFSLWFYGLGFRRMPEYVASLLEHLCKSPDVVQPLFVDPLPRAPASVRIVFYEYHFTPPGAADWWTRSEVARTRDFSCH